MKNKVDVTSRYEGNNIVVTVKNNIGYTKELVVPSIGASSPLSRDLIDTYIKEACNQRRKRNGWMKWDNMMKKICRN